MAQREDHDVPAATRKLVLARDNQCCRVCGQFVEQPALHHIVYRSHGGSNDPSNLVTVGWLYGHDCHLGVAHANARLWVPVLTQVAITDGVNGLQLLRWYRNRKVLP